METLFLPVMSTFVEEKSSSKLEESPEAKRLPKFSYGKDFLLSLSGLDICKKLPRGFDVSLLSVLEDASNKLEPQRNLVGTYFQKWNESGPHSIRLESSSNYSWGSHGRWDTHSSGSSDREELQSDHDSDYRRCYLNPSCTSWKHSEHDGLLGRPSGYSGQTSAQRLRGYRSTEPCQPP